MSKGYYYEDGELIDVEDYSCDGQEERYCPYCKKQTLHFLDCVSMRYGYVWRCFVCNKRDDME